MPRWARSSRIAISAALPTSDKALQGRGHLRIALAAECPGLGQSSTSGKVATNGGSLGPAPAYNSNGLWLIDVAELADEAQALVGEGDFKGLKLRLGRERLADDLAAIDAVRSAVGSETRPFKLVDGSIVIPGRLGAGIDWNEDAVKRYRYDP